jgi:hypothetical protein
VQDHRVRRHQGHGQIALPLHLVGEDRRFRRGADLWHPSEHEVSVGDGAALGQSDDAPSGAQGLDGDVVVEALNLCRRQAGIQMDRQRQAVFLAGSGPLDRAEQVAAWSLDGSLLRDGWLVRLGFVGDGLQAGLRQVPGRRRTDQRGLAPGCVARRHDHGKAQLEPAVAVKRAILILDLDRDLLAGADVGERGDEDIGPGAAEQARLAPLRRGLLVDLLGLLARQDAALDATLADRHDQPVHRRALGQGKDVDPFQPNRGGVDEALAHPGARHLAADPDDHVGLEAGRFEQGVVAAAAKEQPRRQIGRICCTLRRCCRACAVRRGERQNRDQQAEHQGQTDNGQGLLEDEGAVPRKDVDGGRRGAGARLRPRDGMDVPHDGFPLLAL